MDLFNFAKTHMMGAHFLGFDKAAIKCGQTSCDVRNAELARLPVGTIEFILNLIFVSACECVRYESLMVTENIDAENAVFEDGGSRRAFLIDAD